MKTTIDSLNTIKPKALKTGDTIAIISPAAPSPSDSIEKGVAYLEAKGFKVKVMPNAAKQQVYLAGNPAERVSDFHQAFADPDIAAILCARGGYGAMQLLPLIDWDLVQQNPKILIGFSDITVLLLTIFEKTGLIGFHGPMLTSNLLNNDAWTEERLFELITAPVTEAPIQICPQLHQLDATSYTCLQAGSAQGILKGGNLTLIAALCGTPWQPSFENSILFIEDWKEAYYSIDRQWEQMKQAGIFKGIRGLVLGDFVKMDDLDLYPDYSLAQQFTELCTQTLDIPSTIPVGLGLPFGHGQKSATLPVGALGHFESTSGRLEIESAPVD